ncbi:hypothetical protein [Parasedimentitalea psychrophila]|uniref:Uncharacterized protein n=1 Tax=Parasedimentitalea psychrophila TaxID=2997337 RepID=A0A9Y2L286_9RHOB|nr:hypothetical protein [Parasedimentitalea psychrophila]WIY26331.1 hypothetical protein QPJ95_05270 [Parasedimentitalea psychrophila]
MKSTTLAVLAVMLPAVATSVSANEYAPAMSAYLENEIQSWAHAPILVDAINAQNLRTSDYDQGMIDQLDLTWRAEIGAASTPTITPVLDNAAAEFLRSQVVASGGRVTEVFIMDAHGLNVAASSMTSDMWQGDEAKHAQTYRVGPDAVHFGDVELDESTQSYQGQISLTITDPTTGQAIGAMTIGIDAESLI